MFFICGFSTTMGKKGEIPCRSRENALWKTMWKV